MRIKDSAILLGINYQTAKSIIRRFRATGKIERSNRILKYGNEDDFPNSGTEEKLISDQYKN